MDNSELTKKVKDNLRLLIDLAAERKDKAERDAMLDRIIEHSLRGANLDELAARFAPEKAAASGTYVGGAGPTSKQRPSLSAKKAALAAVPDLAAGGEIAVEPRRRGRPRIHAKPKYDPKYPALQLLDDFQIQDPALRKRLEKMIQAARANSEGGRGIPLTETPESYRFHRRGGPVPAASKYLIGGEVYEVVPPIVSKGSGGESNAIWVEFEKLLFGIDDKREVDENTKRRENEIRCSRSMQNAGITWIEGEPTVLASYGVPTITADVAREILSAVPEFRKKGREFLDLGPSTWLDAAGSWTDEFAALIRDAYLGKVEGFGRKERFALARMLIEPIGSIEHKMYEIAFGEKHLLGE